MLDENLRDWFGKDGVGGGGWDRYNTKGERVGKCARDDKDGDGKADGPKPKCLPKSKARSLGKKGVAAAVKRKRAQDSNPDRKGKAINVKTESTEMELQEKEGKKDACYHKVKASASVWPSAYASGRLVQCRKKGAKNYGKSKKNEAFLALPEFSQAQIDALKANGVEVEIISERNMSAARANVGAKKCWDGYTAKGTKTKNGREVPNCVKDEVEYSERDKVLAALRNEGVLDAALKADKDMGKLHKKVDKDVERMKAGKKFKEEAEYVEEQRAKVRQNGNIYIVGFTWLGKYMIMKLFFPEVTKPSRREAEVALQKIYPGARMQRFDQAPYNPSEPMLYMGVQENEEVEYIQEKEVDVPDTRRTVDAIRAYDRSKDASRDATSDSDRGKKKKAAKERAYAKKERGEIKKDDPNWKKRKYHTGMHGEAYEAEEKKNLAEKSAAWQRKEGKNKTGGLNEKGRKSYERENPGSDLKAPQPEGGPRKRSFCARMGGVKGPMKDEKGRPTRKALALRKWKC